MSAIVLIDTGSYGILPFQLFLPAGISALKYKPKPEEDLPEDQEVMDMWEKVVVGRN